MRALTSEECRWFNQLPQTEQDSLRAAADKAGMSLAEYIADLNKSATELQRWWAALRQTGWQPGDDPAEFVHKLVHLRCT
jgi:hypothetical protein